MLLLFSTFLAPFHWFILQNVSVEISTLLYRNDNSVRFLCVLSLLVCQHRFSERFFLSAFHSVEQNSNRTYPLSISQPLHLEYFSTFIIDSNTFAIFQLNDKMQACMREENMQPSILFRRRFAFRQYCPEEPKVKWNYQWSIWYVQVSSDSKFEEKTNELLTHKQTVPENKYSPTQKSTSHCKNTLKNE